MAAELPKEPNAEEAQHDETPQNAFRTLAALPRGVAPDPGGAGGRRR
jgi:hypothetical protein